MQSEIVQHIYVKMVGICRENVNNHQSYFFSPNWFLNRVKLSLCYRVKSVGFGLLDLAVFSFCLGF